MAMGPEDERNFFRDDRSRQAFRRKMLDEIPAWYSPWVHLCGTVGIGVAAIVCSAFFIQDLTALQFLTIPIVLALSNLGEWHAHRHLLHRRWKPMAVLYDRHTPEHHRVYRYRDMAVTEWRELRLVLIPAMGVFGIVLAAAPAAALAGYLLGPNVGWLFLASAAAYVVCYEVTHLCYHLPEDSFIGRRAFIRFMREHHARHHDPRLMQKWNFNVTLPFGDWIFSTVASQALIDSLTPDRTAAEPNAPTASNNDVADAAA